MHRPKSTWKPKQQAIMALVLGLVLLNGVVGISTPSSPTAAQGREPIATQTAVPSPIPTAVPTVSSDATDDEAPLVGLFSDVDGEPPPSIGVETLESRLVGIDLGQLDQVAESPVGPRDPVTGKPQPPNKLVLNLFDDATFTGIVEHVEPTASGHALWGSLEGVELGTMTLVVNGSIVVGTVRTPETVYTIRTTGDGTYVIREIDESSLPPPGEPLEPSPSPRDSAAESDDIPPDDGSVIDVMVVYTPLAKHREGGRAAIEALIDLFVAETNQAYANSGVIHRIRLVLREEVDYIEEGEASIDLQRLQDASDGYIDHVHERRDLYAADLVHILVSESDYGGFAYISTSESEGFGLTLVRCGALCFAHELGHNMGLHHDRYQLGGPRTGYGYGYVNQRMFEAGAPESAQWRTIMSYNSQCWEIRGIYCDRIGYFSNPEKTLYGDPMGVPADNPSTGVDGPADGVRSLNERRQITANFRRSSSSPTPRVGLNLSPYWLSERGGVSTVTAILHRPSTSDTTVTVSASPADAVTFNGNGLLTIYAGEMVSRGVVTITGVNNDERTGDVIVNVSASAANPSNLGVKEPETVELAISDDETTPVVTLSLSPAKIVEFEGRTVLTASLDNRSYADTTVKGSATPANIVGGFGSNTLLTIPAGQLESNGGVGIYALNDDALTENEKTVTVSGAAINPHGVTGPDNVTLTIIDDEAPYFAHDSITYSFTEGVAGGRFLPEAAYGNGELTYSLSPTPVSEVTFTPVPPAHIWVPASLQAGRKVSYTLSATDADGDTDTMTIIIAVREGECPNSAAVAGYSDPEVVSDCEALLSSRDTLSFDRSLNWDEDLPISEWEGVELDAGRVVGINLTQLGLIGTVPGELGNLANLRDLRLESNQLTGGIPTELGRLSNLKVLFLGSNELTGGIPKELGNLYNLEELNIADSGLTGEIPAELGNLSNLLHLSLSNNQLTGGIPTDLGRLLNLSILALDHNQLTGSIPVELGELARLLSLSLMFNQLSGPIPSELGSLSSLLTLSLWENQLTGGIPKELGSLTNLQALNLNENQLTGEIPKELGSLTNLQILILSENRLTGEIPTELGDLSELIRLFVNDNRLMGEIPAELENLPNLRELYLRGNPMTGCVPDGLRDVPNTDFAELGLPFCVDLACSTLAGSSSGANNPGLVSDCVALLTARDTLAGTATLNWSTDTPIADWSGVVLEGKPGRVSELRLGNLGLTGEIPPEFRSLSALQHLNLSDNNLTKSIPTELGDLSNLQELYLGGNGLSGCVPDELRDIPNNDLASLGLPFCSEHPCVSRGALEDATNPGLLSDCETLLAARDTLAGTAALNWATNIPITEWDGVGLEGMPQRVVHLRLLVGGLTGEIPKELGSLANLQSLNLNGNQLNGDIPTELGKLSYLVTLDLSSNQLTGEIPPELGNLVDLRSLHISNNQLMGEIPTELGNLSNLQYLFLSSNLLTGEIPTGLGNLSNLITLDLSSNQLTGEIPTELGNLSILPHLFLSSNLLTGEIPTELGNLSYLLTLDLSGNQLSGEIPTELGRLIILSDLLLNHNDLEGSIPASLGRLRNLERFWLRSNRLTGCVPPRLQYVPDNDFDQQGLSFCALSPPDAPTIGSVTPELDSLAISWSPPLSDGGSDITAYDLRHIETSADETVDSNWTAAEDVWTTGGGDLEYTLTGLTADTQYDIQVRAVNAEGDGSWSETVTGSPTSSICVTGGAVTDATNTGLISDCETLLDSHGILDSAATLNWSSDTPIADWDGITVRGTPERVAWLNIREAGLNGSLPAELGLLSSLTYLNLRNNGLTGPIPTELGDLTNLRYLGLNNNELTGPIPDLSRMTHLEQLYLSNNDLTGDLPDWMGTLTNVRELWLWGNELEGTIPDLRGMTGLVRIKLQANNFTGGIPTWLGDMTDLVYLYLHQNMLTGEIPSELGDMESLRYLWLHTNDLTGEIPPELGMLSNLWDLNLHSNDLTGDIPAELGDLSSLTHLRLHRNELEGAIPDALGDLESLRYMWLHGNMLSGSIPAELRDMEKLERLWLSENELTGQIPEELGDLSNLVQWRLADNDFSGCLPAGLSEVQDTDFDSLGLQVCTDP